MRLSILMIVVVAIFASVVAAQNSAPTSNTAAPPGDAANGKKIWAAYGCYQCHGYEAQGGGAGVRLAPNPLPFAYVLKYTRQPTRDMPPYTSKVVSDQEIADIYAFLLSIPQPPAVASIPQLAK